MAKGLTGKQVEERKNRGQINISGKRKLRTDKEIIQKNVLTFFNLINIILFIFVLITGRISNGTFIGTIIANTFIGIYQEIKARNILKKMTLLIESKCNVLRDGHWQEISSEEIVINDYVRIKSGETIPADCELQTGYLEVNESMLTGESNNRIKHSGDTLYAGTIVTAGDGEAEVIKVGKDCFRETIMKDAQKYTPAVSRLNRDMEKLLRIISFLLVPIGVALFLTQYFALDLSWQDSILKTVSALVGMIPEGIVVLTSIALAVSMMRLASMDVLVQDMYAIETLARVDVICTDKTGTLTKGTMRVNRVEMLPGVTREHLEQVMGSYVRVFQEGNATSDALAECFRQNDIYEEETVLPFSSERKYAGVSFKTEGSYYLGAVNFLFPHGAGISKTVARLTANGDRVLVLGHSDSMDMSRLPEDLEPVALFAISDVLRDNVDKILRFFKAQGVEVKVLSGDDARTVSVLAEKAGVENAHKYVDMSAQKFRDPSGLVGSMTVYGRVLPEQKKAMIKALQDQGHVVAMIGDGVNDVPALKQADVSIAMSAGSSAARDSSNIVLLNNDFGTMVPIVKEGRRVINNISRAASMYLVKTCFSVMLSFYTIFLHQEYPFLPIHLSIISAFAVAIPTFFLQMESSFEKVSGSFLKSAAKRALPTAVTILLLTLSLTGLESLLHLSDYEFNGILVFLTAFAYLFTLYRVYSPMDRMRMIVLVSMCVCVILSMIFLQSLLQVTFTLKSVLLTIPFMVLIPFVITTLAEILERITSLFQKD